MLIFLVLSLRFQMPMPPIGARLPLASADDFRHFRALAMRCRFVFDAAYFAELMPRRRFRHAVTPPRDVSPSAMPYMMLAVTRARPRYGGMRAAPSARAAAQRGSLLMAPAPRRA